VKGKFVQLSKAFFTEIESKYLKVEKSSSRIEGTGGDENKALVALHAGADLL
jgi:hypothetical protein